MQAFHRKFIELVGTKKNGQSVEDSGRRKSHSAGLITYAERFVAPANISDDLRPIEIHQVTSRGQDATPLLQVTQQFETAVSEALARSAAQRKASLAMAPRLPRRIEVTTTVFDRSPDVVAEVLSRACGSCESCTKPAPFLRRGDGSPYLEVHHRIPLAAGGEDTVENAIALCPNCHRAAHYA